VTARPVLTVAAQPGIWIGASYVLGRDVPVDGPYPHICAKRVPGRMTPGAVVITGPRDCAACVMERAVRRRPRTTAPTVPAVDAMALAAGDTEED